ncbi:hypothetical protein MST27_04705 [Pseudomonas sp. PS1]|uniref:Lipoprotein n=1 Tax=Stutzerimonas marianensis TaxID=2929513 RepID=A0A9X2ARM5_9GAMM|nr:hypothetical protein [Pseudomonas marianensis]MCJ0972665.1 hypothetical protein [Pseudomonas marianensis]
MTPSCRVLLLALLPVFAGCQSLSGGKPTAPTERLQGTVERVDGQLMLTTCRPQRQLELIDTGDTGLPDDVLALSAGQPLYADVRGHLAQGRLELTRVYRLQAEGPGCDDPDLPLTLLRASGHEPGWNVVVTKAGMLLNRLGDAPMAVPYLEEQLPDGQTSFSSEANTQRIDLWVAPQRCVDSASGAVTHLTAELRLDDQTLRGCAYYGGARSD